MRAKIFPVLMLGIGLSSCGPDPLKDAQDICDCFTKANSLSEEDPQRITEQDKCSELQLEKTSKYTTNDEVKNFGEALSDCSDQIIRQALEDQ